MRADDVIDLESEETWPEELRSLLQERAGLLRDFERETARIERLCDRNVQARIRPPVNPHERTRTAVLRRVEAIIAGKNLLGFHCTRLHEDEIRAILNEGLVPLSTELVTARVQSRVNSGDITEAVATKLLSHHQAADENRRGMIWFVFSKSILADGSGVWNLFRSWGGEALYQGHEEHSVCGTALRRIGSPSIVVASVPLGNTLEPMWPVGERFVARWLRQRRIRTHYPAEMEGYMSVRLVPERILKVIERDDPAFEKLTNCRKWHLPI